jgi:hypothetical protein
MNKTTTHRTAQLSGLSGALVLSATAFGGYTGLTTTVESATDVAGYAVVRVWANFDATDDKLVAIYGTSVNPLSITTTDSAGFYQNGSGSDFSSGINAALYDIDLGLRDDTWMTIGCVDQDGIMADGSQNTDGGNALLNIGITVAATTISTTNGSWYVTPDDSQSLPIDGSVLIGQFTVQDYMDYTVSGTVSLLWRDAAEESTDELSETFTVDVNTALLQADFNEDGHVDIIWQSNEPSLTGRTKVFYQQGEADDFAFIGSAWVWPLGTSWSVCGYGDFDQDGHQDVLFRATQGGSTGMVKAFKMDGNGTLLGSDTVYPAGDYTCMGANDFNHDGNLDLVLQSTLEGEEGRTTVVLLDGPDADTPYAELDTVVLWSTSTLWDARTSIDWDGDGGIDMVWQSPTGKTKVFLFAPHDAADPYAFLGSFWLYEGGTYWSVRAARDFNLDGTPDLLWQRPGGTVKIFFYDGETFSGSNWIYDFDTVWSVY